jgi:hypothetical protein
LRICCLVLVHREIHLNTYIRFSFCLTGDMQHIRYKAQPVNAICRFFDDGILI